MILLQSWMERPLNIRCVWKKFDAAIIDIIMPKKNGYQVCRDLRRDPAYKDVPIIMVSSKNQTSDKMWGLKQGANEYITKPFNPKDLVSVVKICEVPCIGLRYLVDMGEKERTQKRSKKQRIAGQMRCSDQILNYCLSAPSFTTVSNLSIDEPLYTPSDAADLDYLKDLGFPG